LDDEWAAMLAAWAIPEDLVAAAPESPYFFDPEVFIAAADEALARSEHTASDLAAREALPEGGSVLDVGAGAGAASVRLGAAQVTGVDPSGTLLAAFADRLAVTGATTTLIEGTWPAVAATTPTADVVVCHHVLYNVPELAAFTDALPSHARHRVVIELTAEHPMAWMRPYWQALHGLQQPDRPTADDAIAVMTRLGHRVQQQRWTRRYQMVGENGPNPLAPLSRRLCLQPDRLDELAALVATMPPPTDREVVTICITAGVGRDTAPGSETRGRVSAIGF
jgi:SAM-dependent methyltransferase